ncbi:MAG: hypothetical protein COZ49_03605 [Candidatus Yonathbacteria bacterium CG_4_10_14_3_um_filter_47_65]|uniref:Prepilin-type N-terminal cleavage/methylation domain-containing protein n=2 Tax=Parcubacteria group TaxID=1794811 RepID=A0A2M8D7X8_9BACT|nr:MAG: hypothetical protein AUJ44_01145 [Candidatus Nomurabacteria bacterium CG1_02_47_685]PIP04236.1 MAG: hypothetical protein COX54_00110 [Candidatus Yonathbacteria bacterium CG23_combo_of_CG06-09_8_20_14_all_46_18]PIQ31937.1 MAG: hypothetical protein COW61_02770 [Candidatus Yonathbacteria bacterium CG17_big_fil_post_rev_8_21_14_2_50_46_19]PIX56144.1 MAG: hypothetical protein COZ49_03605 [Candidatus Yonathbacteria bacterium CG_4_10_14_3_um_filter_47_65]PIY57988.1 MAG: hypothetical protein CO
MSSLKKFCSSRLPQGGFGLIEVVIATAILASVLLGVSFFFQTALRMSRNTTHLVQANFLSEEGIEAVKLMRDDSWDNIANLAAGIDYYLDFDGVNFATTTTDTYIDGMFDRSFTVSDVRRDGNNDIATVGVIDPNTKKIALTVAWNSGYGTSTRTIETYITNLFNL